MARDLSVTPDQFTEFGALLRYLRRRAGLTQRDLSIAVGYSESQISRLEKNERAPDEASLAARFVPALQLERDPEWTRRLLELGKATHERPATETPHTLGTPNNLPVPLTSFIGREKELGEIRGLPIDKANPARLLTLTGPGGCGKTRLALELASQLMEAFPDGIWFAELAPLQDPALLVPTLKGILSLDVPEQNDLVALSAALGEKRMLLVLDNCEHLVQPCAEFAEGILSVCPNVCVLATSREMLGAAGERSIYVRSLTLPEANAGREAGILMQYGAVRLFVERARAVQPAFALNEANADAVVQICRQLDGIPLAIELAAARLRMLSAEQIAARLDSAFRLLTGGRRTALPRHQTLQALIDWSYDLLSPQEQLLFQRLAVFAGGWTLEAAETICNGEGIERGEVMDLLAQLIAKSMVQFDPDAARYRLLETMRQYAQSRLVASGEANAVRQKFASYYFGLAEQGAPYAPHDLTGMDWMMRLESEQDNLRAALLLSLGTMEDSDTRPATDTNNIWMTAWALNRIGWMARERGDFASARQRLEASYNAYCEMDNAQGMAWSLITLGEVYVLQENPARAEQVITEGLRLARELNEVGAVGWGLNHLGHVAMLREDWETANALETESLCVFERRNNPSGAAWAHLALGEIALAQGDIVQTKYHVAQTLEMARLDKDPTGFMWSLNTLAGVAVLENSPAHAAWFWGASDGLCERKETRHPAPVKKVREELSAQAGEMLGASEFERMYREGYDTTLERALQAVQEYLR